MWLSKMFKKKPVDPVFAALTDARGARCPDCKGEEFIFGPSGGLARNVRCNNKNCGSEFNLAPFEDGWLGKPFMAARISGPSPLKKGVLNGAKEVA